MRPKYLSGIALFCTLLANCSSLSHNDSIKCRKFNFVYDASVESIPEEAKNIEIWIPLPPNNSHQQVSNLKVTAPVKHEQRSENLYGNTLLYFKSEDAVSPPFKINISMDIERHEVKSYSQGLSEQLRSRLIQPDSLGVINEEVKKISQKLTSEVSTTHAKGKVIYDYVLGHMEYNKTVPGWGKGDTIRACEIGKGNCSDYHSLFISLIRASQIPARFFYGFAIPKEASGGAIAHCWAEFYVEEESKWIPVDASEADKKPEMKDYYFGAFDENRIEFSMGRDIILDPPQKGSPLNFFIHPYVEIDGEVHESVKASYTYTNRKY
ncbi:MAG: transglutaminase domain-containing protein [Planctomycetes bacterium]|nr:transglutaminase domain-containing protein [Planctomycetota bacterium]